MEHTSPSGLASRPQALRAPDVRSNDRPPDRPALEVIADDLRNMREEYGNIAVRIQLAADRAFGPDKGGTGVETGGEKPIGTLGSIGEQIQSLRAIANHAREHLARLERVS